MQYLGQNRSTIYAISGIMLLASAGTCAVAADVSAEQLNKDLAALNFSPCRPAAKSVFLQVDCVNSIQRPVWLREAPSTIDLYETWNARRIDAATKYDNGILSSDGLKASIKASQTELWAQVVRRNQYAAQEMQPVQQPQVVQQQQDDNTALWLGMGGAFLNGYNGAAAASAARAPVMTTCTKTGMITNCLSN